MTNTADALQPLVHRIQDVTPTGRRKLIALAGPPASGKSTQADWFAQGLSQLGCNARVIPMDGFHLDNRILQARGLLGRKGAPQTFDAAGFYHLITRLKSEDDVVFPEFDRARDIAIAGAACVDASVDTLIVEGNYLLLDAPVWRDLYPLWDLRIRLDVPEDVLQDRLVKRWRDHGLSPEMALHRAEENDLPNARLVQTASLAADIIY